jgi:hypothetical protein
MGLFSGMGDMNGLCSGTGGVTKAVRARLIVLGPIPLSAVSMLTPLARSDRTALF